MQAWKDRSSVCLQVRFSIHTPPFYQLARPNKKRLLWRGNEYFHGLNDFSPTSTANGARSSSGDESPLHGQDRLCPTAAARACAKSALYVRIGGKTIADLVVMPVETLRRFLASLELDAHDTKTAARILTEIRNRLQYLTDVGLELPDPSTALLDAFRAARASDINLSTSLGSNLVGSLYILDEPSIGLHPRDTNRLVGVRFEQLRDIGNTVIVVEHEEEVIRAADWIVDIGPEAGYNGGRSSSADR